MVFAVARIDVCIDVFFLQIEVGAAVFGIAANKVLKGLVSYLCHQPELFIVLKQITNF